MTNLQKAIKIINKRLPDSYLVPIRTYKTSYNLMKGYCRLKNVDYQKTLNWYTKYLLDEKTATYIQTKYWRRWKDLPKFMRKGNHRIKGYDISAISTNPIFIAESEIKGRTVTELVYLIIHEFGHHWLDRNGYDSLNERWCDEFSIRWTRKLIKEGLVPEIK